MTISTVFLRINHRVLLKLLMFFCLLIFIISCKEAEPEEEKTLLGSGYILNGELYYFDYVTCYRTDWGEIFNAREGNLEFIFILSDTSQIAYSITDTLFSTDQGKFRCTLESKGIYIYATEGSVQYDRQKNTAHFEINPFGVNTLDGILIPDTIIWEPFLDFTGITMRDESGVPMNTEDETDWGIRKTWKIAEAQLFNLEDNTTNPGPKYLKVYPNPVQNQCMLDFINTSGNYDLEMILVNPNMEIERTYTKLKDTDMNLLLDDPAYNGHNYRLYFHQMKDSYSWYGSGDLNFSE